MFNRLMRLIPVLLPIMATTIGLAACASEADSEMHVAQAQEYREKGDLTAAIIELKRALELRPDDADARLALGRIYLDIGDGASAEKELTRAATLGVKPADTTVDLTRAYLLQHQFSEVVSSAVDEVFQGADALASLDREDRAELFALRGHAFLALGRLEAAADHYDKALSEVPGLAEAAVGKAQLAIAHGDLKESRARLEKLLTDHPDYGPAWRLLGDLERSQGNLPEAEAAYGKAIEHEYNKWQSLLSRAFTRLALEDHQGAEEDLKTVREAGVGHPSGEFASGLLSFRANEDAGAQTAFEDALRLDPDYMPAVLFLGFMHLEAGRLDQAERYSQRSLSVAPRSDGAAVARLLRDDYSGAESVLRPVLARRPADPQLVALVKKATLKREVGKTDDEVAFLDEVMARQAVSAGAHFLTYVGPVAAGVARRENAERKRLGEAFEAGTSDEPDLLLSLGVEKLKRGDARGSAAALERAIALAPDLVDAKAMLILERIGSNDLEAARSGARELIEEHPERTIGYNLLGLASAAGGDTEDAKDAFRRALEIDPTDHDAANNLGLMLFNEQNFEEAREAFLTVLRHRPGHLNALLHLAVIEARAENEEKAVDWLEQAVAGNPGQALPRTMLGQMFLEQGRDVEALRLTEEFSDRDDASPGVLRVLATAQLRRRLFREAARTLVRLSELQPRSADVHQQLARAYQMAGRVDDALAASARALSLDPSHEPTMYLRARLLTETGQFREAQQLVDSLKAGRAESVDLLELEGTIALRQSRFDEGVAAYRRAFELKESNLQLAKLAGALFAAGRSEEGATLLDNWLAEYPEDTMTLWLLASHHFSQDQYSDAEVPLTKLVELHPDSADARNDLAWALMKQRRLPEALTHATRARELKPDDAEILDTLGSILFEMDENDRAVSVLTKAANASDGNPEIQTNLARALLAVGRIEEARAFLSKALSSPGPFPNRAEAERLCATLDK